MVIREVEFSDKEIKSTVETAFYIGSIEKVKDFAFAARNHWGVESMHWSLDVTFGDDENRVRKGMAPQNMAVLKRIAFNAVKKDTQIYPKQSMKARRFMAMGNPEYRDYLLDLNLLRVRFVLVKHGSTPFILMCSDLNVPALQIIELYGYRFKVEVTFKSLKQTLGSFCYHFWTTAMPKLSRKITETDLSKVTDPKDKQRIVAEQLMFLYLLVVSPWEYCR